MNRDACATSKGDRLYIIEVFVDQVNLYIERSERVIPADLGVDLKFAEFPLFRILQAGFEFSKREKEKEIVREEGQRKISYKAGDMHMFAANPADLIRAMRSEPLLLDVYRIKEVTKCPEGILKDPLGSARIPLPGCLCDQVIMSANDPRHLPRSYVVKNTFGLTYADRKPSGTISLLLRLSCHGRYVANQYAIHDKVLLIKNHGSSNEFICKKIPLADEAAKRAEEEESKVCFPDKEFEESELDLPPTPRNVAGLASICRQLAESDGHPPEIASIIRESTGKNPEPVAKESRSDSRVDANEIPCVCPVDGTYLKLYTGEVPCKGTNCHGGLCIGLRRLNIVSRDHHGGTLNTPCYTGSCCAGCAATKNRSNSPLFRTR